MIRRCLLFSLAFAVACDDGSDDDTTPGTDSPTGATDTELQPTDDTEVEPPPGPVEADLVGEAVTCGDPSLRTTDGPFARITARRQDFPAELYRLVGGGLVVADFTGDDKLDIFLPGWDQVQLHRKGDEGNSFVEESELRLPAGVDLNYGTAATAADVEGDGDLDLFVTRWDLPNVLLINDGTGTFTDGTETSRIRGIAHSLSSAWADMDGDGDLDLFVGNYGPHPNDAFATAEDFTPGDASQIWENLGAGRFREASEPLTPQLQEAYTFLGAWQDLDGDQRPELLVINDFGWARPSQILWNRRRGLTVDDTNAGFDIAFAGMGLGMADLNGDEILDFVQSSWRESSVLISQGGLQWFESAQVVNLLPDWEGAPTQIFGWGTEVVDIDNDADHDVVMNYGYWDEWSVKATQLDALYVRGDDGQYHDDGAAWGLADEGPSRGLVVADLNQDGWPDVIKRVLDDKTPLYLSRCGEAGWLHVRVRQGGANPFGIGTRVRIVDGSDVFNGSIRAGGTGMFSGGPPEVLVGLGDRDRVDRLEITWPDGATTSFVDVDTRQRLVITRR